MTQKYNICLAQPDNYPHTGAFSEIADLIQFALRDLGYEAAIHKNKIDPSARNILIGIHLMTCAMAKVVPADTIILNTEQLGSTLSHWNKNIVEWFSHDFTLWDYSDANVSYLNDFGVKRVEKLQIGYQKELCRITPRQKKDIDVLFYGSVSPRRKKILDDLRACGLTVKQLEGTYGKSRDDWISRSRMVLNLHFYDSQIFEIVRAFYLMTNGIPLASELNSGTMIDECYRDGILGLPYDGLAEGIAEVLQDEAKLERIGKKGNETIARYPQAHLLREIL
ncbi:glycosyltransferase family 1 protein [Leisingera sp. ANG-DT]|uniref:glycosyltransferase family 1 protein n=1 Tax=Leisingera sp. ANG-DT TaxID=1577897 RepID=UPI00057DD762|nr:glycosyltransferase family 1 protein [Leisingera sp. ANG-DT]KIC19307.1 hypothetical protein RA21_02020 [Leisingera sp. ANG-DT]